jgi:hypothetical protein
MARTSSKSQPSIAQLKDLLKEQRTRRTKLLSDRKKLQAKIDQIDRQIDVLDGAVGGGGGTGLRARNEHPLPDVIEVVLKSNKKPMKVGEIVDAVQENGYQSTSVNFKSIVNQALIKDDRFTSESRGLYRLA